MSKANVEMVLTFINQQPLLNPESCDDDDVPDLIEDCDQQNPPQEIESYPYTIEYEDYGIDILDLPSWKGP